MEPKIYLEIIFNYCDHLISNNIQVTLQTELLKIAWDLITENTTATSTEDIIIQAKLISLETKRYYSQL